MVCACAHGLELGRSPVGAHSVRPLPCGKSRYGIYRKAPERSLRPQARFGGQPGQRPGS